MKDMLSGFIIKIVYSNEFFSGGGVWTPGVSAYEPWLSFLLRSLFFFFLAATVFVLGLICEKSVKKDKDNSHDLNFVFK